MQSKIKVLLDARKIPRPAAAPPPAEAGGLPEYAGLRDDASQIGSEVRIKPRHYQPRVVS